MELCGDNVALLEGNITELGAAGSLAEGQVVAILELDDFDFAIDSVYALEVASGDSLDFYGKVVSTNMV